MATDACPQTPKQMSENLMSVHSRRVITLTRTGARVSEWEVCQSGMSVTVGG
jgi:hypothetical protein